VRRVHALTFALAADCAAIGGVLAGIAFSFDATTGTGYLLTGFAVVVLGGLGSVAGTQGPELRALYLSTDGPDPSPSVR
jgi:branched-chain amino acid transport system permease protein